MNTTDAKTADLIACLTIADRTLEAYRINGRHLRFTFEGSGIEMLTAAEMLDEYAGTKFARRVAEFVADVAFVAAAK